MTDSSSVRQTVQSCPERGQTPEIRLAKTSERAAALNAHLAEATPECVIEVARSSVEPGRFAVVSSFGAESAALLAAVAAVDPTIPVLLIDTGYLFPETLAYRDALIVRLGLADVRTILPDPEEVARDDAEGDLWARKFDACCALRKTRPLARALARFDAWANGRKRYQGAERSFIPIVEAEGQRLKFNPLAGLSHESLVARFKALDLPPHPLERFGFASIGCMQCTSRVQPGESLRAGRWRGAAKTECGIHLTLDPVSDRSGADR